jgi:hypothetical protein
LYGTVWVSRRIGLGFEDRLSIRVRSSFTQD